VVDDVKKTNKKIKKSNPACLDMPRVCEWSIQAVDKTVLLTGAAHTLSIAKVMANKAGRQLSREGRVDLQIVARNRSGLTYKLVLQGGQYVWTHYASS
jgi:hypothetical protein